MKRTTKIFLYFGFALLMLVFFLYVRFPSDIIKDVLFEKIQAVSPKAELLSDEINLTIPPGLKLTPLTVKYEAQSIVELDDFKVVPNLFSLFSSSKYASYRGNIANGIIEGRADTVVQNNRQQTKLAAELIRIPLKRIDIINQWEKYKPDGELDGRIKYDSLKSGGSADITLKVTPAKITFNPPLLGIEGLTFSQIKSHMILTRRNLQIRNCDISGDQVQGKITGSIVFRQPFENSRLRLSMTVKPQPAFIEDHKNDPIGVMLATATASKRGLVVRISGTIKNPKYEPR